MGEQNIRAPRLDDRYDLGCKRVFVTGMQAIVRLLLEQHEHDVRAGLTTGGFVSGYRGSPIGRLDSELWSASKQLKPRRIHFQPGVNEELAATAVWGSQQTRLVNGEDADVDGVFGLWYGKGPGVDRSGDVFKHANMAGSAPKGGVLVLAGDDPASKSSTIAHQSEQALSASMIPVLAPADLQDVLDLGIIGYGMSRFSGCWVGLKVTTAIADSSVSIDTTLDRITLSEPSVTLPSDGLHIRWPDDRVEQEARLTGPKLDAVKAYAHANGVDRLVWPAAGARIGIVTTGRAHHDVMDALRARGIGEAEAEARGIRLFKVGMPWPLEPSAATAFTEGLDQILVVEEKRGLIEPQLKEMLYGRPDGARPLVIGKTDAAGQSLLRQYGELDPVLVDRALDEILGVPAARAALVAMVPPLPDSLVRKEFFCAGCPHNRSTRVPEDSIALAGIGCHTMASRMPDRRTITVCQMGGEGATWIGQAPFTKRRHVFQNLGDGTYFHSGFLAIRATIAAGINITYKILFNDAVAMTGGQPVDGTLGVEAMCAELAAEGVRRIVVVTDAPERSRQLPAGTTVRHRDDLDAVQRELREEEGVTILLYEQVCASEKRRRRKRKLMPDPPKRLFINERVCEGCGDCVKQSSCIAVAPVATPYGRKRAIDQSTCNKDFSCVDGFCPSFVEIEGAQLRRIGDNQVHRWLEEAGDLPAPASALDDRFHVLITGIGGTGVVTVGAILAMAAHLDGLRAQVLDQTGLAQKNGAVSSHVTIARPDREIGAVRIGDGNVDVLISCDLAVAAAPVNLALLSAGRSRAVVNSTLTPTAGQTMSIETLGDDSLLAKRLARVIGEDAIAACEAGTISRALLGDSVFSNMLMLGYGWQQAAIPVSLDNMRAAIRLNGTAVDLNLAAFELGRHIADKGPAAVETLLPRRDAAPAIETLDIAESRGRDLLTGFQDRAYADRYSVWVHQFVAAERAHDIAGAPLSRQVATSLARIMAYKDEYEVARLYSDGEFRAALQRQFVGTGRMKVYLAPPILSKVDPATGRPAKRAFGPWMFKTMALLAKFKWLRTTSFDPFGRTAERRDERALISHYEALMAEVLDRLTPGRIEQALALLGAITEVRGYGPVKDANLAAYHERIAKLRDGWRQAQINEQAAPDRAPASPAELGDAGMNGNG